jgi:phosphopantetheine adenylyltransferase
MAIIWNDERLTPERMLGILKKERDHWLETADAFERLTTYLNSTFALQDAEQRVKNCRARAEALCELIKTIEEQINEGIVPPKPPTGFTTFMIQ